jgi:hypothetical protein
LIRKLFEVIKLKCGSQYWLSTRKVALIKFILIETNVRKMRKFGRNLKIKILLLFMYLVHTKAKMTWICLV